MKEKHSEGKFRRFDFILIDVYKDLIFIDMVAQSNILYTKIRETGKQSCKTNVWQNRT